MPTRQKRGCWIGGDAYTAVAVAKKVGEGSWTVYNIFRDHLGTITHLKNGSNPADEYSFDAWGRRRDKDDWTYTLSSEPALLADRGFTSHEYLEDFKLYNMNGRLYDPVVGRFLSADPYIQAPDFTQNFNRYSYCMNNPLKFTDPSGNKLKWKWKWLNPVYWLGEAMQALNDNTEGLRNEMSKMGIPDFNGGVTVNGSGNVNVNGSIMGREVINTANKDRSNAEQVVNKEINQVRQDYWQAWHATDIVGAIDFSYNLTEGNQYLGTGLTALSTYFTGRRVYSDYKNGGWEKVSKSDMISTSVGIVGVGAKAAQWGGLGRIALYAGESASVVGNAVFVYDLWWNAVYKPMNDLRYAPSSIDSNGLPYYGDDLPPNAYWGTGF